jgi:hypothetical protein
MEFTPRKFLISIILVIGVGMVAIMMQNKNPRQIATDSYMLTTKAITEKAREACPEAVRKHTNVILGLPNDTVSDGERQVTLNWKGGGAGNPLVACTYVLDKGVVALTIDGKPVGS